jgi:peptide/nickel transport system ATP-binding protein
MIDSPNYQFILEAINLNLDINTEQGQFPLLQDASFKLKKGEVLGIVGESGSGKTITCLSITKLLTHPPFIYKNGKVLFINKNIWELSLSELRKIRGKDICYIFQEAQNALNPVVSVGKQVSEILELHQKCTKSEAKNRTLQIFVDVGIPLPDIRYKHFPHQLSGGLQQRVMIAMALAGDPQLLIADEPTTALDVTIQIQIIDLLKRLKARRNMSIIFVSHDLGIIAEICDRVLVMYAGQIIEKAPVNTLFYSPLHPYTVALLNTIPRLNGERGQFKEIPGRVPSPSNYPNGCKFHPRCPFAQKKCEEQNPPIFLNSNDHEYRCWYPQNINN